MKATDFFPDSRVADLAETAADGKSESVDRAIARGANPNTEGKDGVTPLLYVLASTRNKDGLRALLRGGADPNRIAPNGFCPLILSARAKDPEFLAVMLAGRGDPNLKNRDGSPVLHLAGTDERWDNVRLLIDSGADMNATDPIGNTLAMNLAIYRNYEQVFWLLSKGADVHVTTKNGDTLPAIIKRATVKPGRPNVQWREKVILFLAQKGVSLPD